MDAVISGVLRFSAPKKVQLTETKINEVIKEVEKLIPELIGAKNIRVSLQLDSGIPAVLVDSTEIEDVFSSILRNAIESVEAEGGIFYILHEGSFYYERVRFSLPDPPFLPNSKLINLI